MIYYIITIPFEHFGGYDDGLMRAGRLRRTLAADTITAQDLEALYLEEMGRAA